MLAFRVERSEASPLHKLFKRFFCLIFAELERLRNLFTSHRPMRVDIRQHTLKMRTFHSCFHPAHLRIATKRDGGEAELRTAFAKADVRPGKTDHELGHAHAERPCRQVVTTFMYEYEHADDDDGAHDDRK